MKKYIYPIFTSTLLGIAMAFLIIKQYESLDNIQISPNAKKIYYIQRGVYSDKEKMENNMKDFQNYIYNVEDNQYHTYIGVSKNKDNASKIQRVYGNNGIETIIKENTIDNSNFIEILETYDKLLNKTEDEESIKVLSRQTLSKYEEYVNGKY